MTLIPEFEIGLLNTWLLVFPLFLSGLLIIMSNKESAKRAHDMSWYSKKEKKVVNFCMTPYYLIILYSLFVPLKFGTSVFSIGFIIYIVSFIALINAYVAYRTVPSGKFAAKGVYKLSRHPQYFFSITALLGVAIAGTSWLIMLLIIMYAIPQHLIIKGEERYCLEKYGEEYYKYMKKTTRYIKIPKLKSGNKNKGNLPQKKLIKNYGNK